MRQDQNLNLSPTEQQALGGRAPRSRESAFASSWARLATFYTAASRQPTDINAMIGRRGQAAGRLVIVDLQGLSNEARQIIVALLSSQILAAASSKTDPTRPCFLVYEEGHNFAPAGGNSISRGVIKQIAAEGRKFGVGIAIISQRPSKLDPDVTSQCNTLITMRIKNPDDQRFIVKSTEQLSQADIDELPALSTGEALISGKVDPRATAGASRQQGTQARRRVPEDS